MGRPAPLSLTTFLAAASGDVQPRQGLNMREEEAMDNLFKCTGSLQRLAGEELEDLVVDVSKIAGRLPWCLDAAPCVLPGILPLLAAEALGTGRAGGGGIAGHLASRFSSTHGMVRGQASLACAD